MAVNMEKITDYDYKIASRLRHCGGPLWQSNFNSAKYCSTESKMQCGLTSTARGRQMYVTCSVPHLQVSIYSIFAHYANPPLR